MQSFFDCVKTGKDDADSVSNMITVSRDIYESTAWEKHGIYTLVDFQTEITINRDVKYSGSDIKITYTRKIGQIVIFYKLKENFESFLQ